MKIFGKPLIGVLLLWAIVWNGCQKVNPNFQQDAADPEYLHQTMKQLTDIIVHDIFSPPVASRIYAYSSIAAYEALRPGFEGYNSLDGQLHDFMGVPQPEEGKEYCFPLAGLNAATIVGKALIFSEDIMDAFRDSSLQKMEAVQMPQDVYDRSMAYGEQVAKFVLAWADKDNYKQTRTFPKYTVTEEVAKWRPTPPDYMDGIEPHWKDIRTLVMDSAQQFKPIPPTPFSTDPKSQFYTEVMEVYNAMQTDDVEERKAIAGFWDCNPYVSHHKGHVMFATKKITPGGHWIGITAIASRKAGADIMKTAAAYTMTSIALFDGFISCWEEKYRSNLVRPETYINKVIDEDWMPFLQTPPFPEYTSGHSVISRAAATALTKVFGDNFAYTDNVEEEFGFPARTFTSFFAASDEAAISRLYGGIHYRPACMEGVKQGEKVGDWVVSHIQMESSQLSSK